MDWGFSVADLIQAVMLLVAVIIFLKSNKKDSKEELEKEIKKYLELKHKVENLEKKVDSLENKGIEDMKEIKSTMKDIYDKINEHIQFHLDEEKE